MKESFLSWNEYSFLFNQKAQDHNVSPNVVIELLNYAKNLYEKKLPIIYDIKHLSFLTGFKQEYLIRAIKNTPNFYRFFNIAKKNGNSREIAEPLPGLKEIQYWILDNIIKKINPNAYNNAYFVGRSIVTNAKYHTKQSKVMNFDIEKYFDNIFQKDVNKLFLEMGYNSEISMALSKLVTLNNSLPQGSPTSPNLSSLLTKQVDLDLFEYCRSLNLRYSRYADDISISGNFNPKSIIYSVTKILKNNSFNINKRKTTIKYQHQRQMVTGVVVNKRLSIKKNEIKDLRQQVYYIKKFGLENHLKKKQVKKKNLLHHLLGKANFYLSVKKTDKDLISLKDDLKKLILQNK